jgi:hypothetical protein
MQRLPGKRTVGDSAGVLVAIAEYQGLAYRAVGGEGFGDEIG